MPLIAVVTPLFPISEEIYRGKPIYKTVLALQRHADVRVFCPLAVYPPLLGPKFRYHRADKRYRPPGVDSIRYFYYSVFPLLSRAINGAVCAKRLRHEIEDTPFDLILSYWIYPEGYGSLQVARERNKPVIIGARGSDLRRIGDPISRVYVRKTIRQADRVLTVSDDLRERAIALGAEPGRVRSIRNGIDHQIFNYKPRNQVRRQLNIPEEHRLIVFVGWLAPSKGTMVLLEAFRSMAATDPNLRLVFIGEGYSKMIQSFVAAHGLEDRVRLLGATASADVCLWMNAADVLCLPSFSEGCPNVLVEATAAGCPIVATDVGGIPEIVTPKTGILVGDYQPTALAAALGEALGKPWDREGIAASSVRTWEHVADETFDVCRELLPRVVSAPKPAAAPETAPAVHVRRKRPRISVVTPYFPIAEEPYRGHSAFHTLRFMKSDADIEVICPIATYPPIRLLSPTGYRYRRVDLTFKPPELKATYFEYPALPVLTRPFNGLTCSRLLRPYLLASKPDVILNYWVYPEGFAAVRLGREHGIPVIVGSIGSDILRPGDPISFRLMRHTLRYATSVITVSEDLRQNAIKLGVAPERVTTVLNGCDRSVFHPRDRAQARARLGVAQDAELLLYIGWISPTKGLTELIDAAAGMVTRHPRLQVALIGEGRAQADLERQARDAGIADRILFLGRKSSPEVSEWLAACDVFTLPSHSEGCPNVIVESISCGRPVVATNIGGIPELLNSSLGIMVPPRNTEKLTAALEDALRRSWDHEGIASQFGRGWEAAAAETLEVCCRAIGLA
jgi:teichuronic acid biosynthesis glycosyltransferase TuaC